MATGMCMNRGIKFIYCTCACIAILILFYNTKHTVLYTYCTYMYVHMQYICILMRLEDSGAGFSQNISVRIWCSEESE